MKELSDIITAYDKAVQAGKSCALATVVHVQGSSYRRPGARMLITDDGMLTGAISGGCLEGDALRKALLAIKEGKNKLVTYDTTNDDDAIFGVQLGCNGIVHILFEPIDENALSHPLILLKKAMKKRRIAVLVTLFSLKNRNQQVGTCFFYSNEDFIFEGQHQISAVSIEKIIDNVACVLGNESSQINFYEDDLLHGFLQFIPPPLSIVIVGAGNDAMPLVSISDLLGWEITLVDGRQSHATIQRFPLTKHIIVTRAEDVLQHVDIDNNTVFVLMTHNYNYDLAVLKVLLNTNINYIGLLGPKTKMLRMYCDLTNDGIEVAYKLNIYSPMGLDIGAETSEEIALSVVSEIKAVMMNKNAQMLRYKEQSVHG